MVNFNTIIKFWDLHIIILIMGTMTVAMANHNDMNHHNNNYYSCFSLVLIKRKYEININLR